MAAIRLPTSMEPLLPLCRTSGAPGPHVWETYADMIACLSAYAYDSDEPRLAKPSLLKAANPIDLGVFRSRGLYSILLTVAIADQRDWQVSKDADRITSIIEAYAAAGAAFLCLSVAFISADSVTEALLHQIRGQKKAAHYSI